MIDTTTTMQAMPSAIMAEKSVVSSMLNNHNLLKRAIAEGLSDDSFWHPQTLGLWQTIQTMQPDDDGGIDLITLVQHLQEVGKLDRCGGPAEVYHIHSHAIGASGWSQWITTLKEYQARRMALQLAGTMSEATDSTEAIAAARQALESLQSIVSGKQRSVSISTAASDFAAKLEADYRAGDLPGQSTGISCLDEICGGMKAGELWVIAAKPSRGKSVMMLQIAGAYIQAGKSVAIHSLEMMSHEVVGRLVSSTQRVSFGSITQPRTASHGDLSKISSGAKKLSEANLWIDASANQSLDTIQVEAERIRDQHGSLDLVIVDYIQLVRGNRSARESREEEVARVSGGLKQLAKKLGCPVITASQLNEANQVRESRAIEQDADALLFLTDDGVKVGKMRNGKRDQVLPINLNGMYQLFE